MVAKYAPPDRLVGLAVPDHHAGRATLLAQTTQGYVVVLARHQGRGDVEGLLLAILQMSLELRAVDDHLDTVETGRAVGDGDRVLDEWHVVVALHHRGVVVA